MKIKDLAKGGIFSDGDWVESKDQDKNGEIRLIQLADIGDGYFIDKSKRYMNKETAQRLKCTYLKKNDILLARMPDPIGRCCLFPFDEKEKYVTVVDICVIRVEEPHHLNYIKYAINSPLIRRQIEEQVTGTTRLRITKKKIGELDIPLPPLASQKKIAAILDAADAHRQKTKQLLAKYDELAQSIFLEMFGPNHDISREWELKEIKDIISNEKGSMRTGPFGSDLLHSEFVDEGIPVLGIDNAVNNKFEWKQKRYITEQKYQKLKRYKVKPRDVIITIMGTVGRTAVVPNDIGIAINSKHLAALTLNYELANPKFISFSFHSDPFILNQIRKNGKGAIMNGLNLGIIKNTKIKLPPITLQNKFENILSNIETQRNQVETGLEKSENLFNSLLQKAFKGELIK